MNMNWTVFFILITGVTAQQPNVPVPTPKTEEQTTLENPQSYIDAILLSYFDSDILEAIAHANRGKNVILSPASIKTVLALILHGAEGNTASEIQATLSLKKDKSIAERQLLGVHQALVLMSRKFSVKTANAVFLASDITPKQDFENYVVSHYFSTVGRINVLEPIRAAGKINEWVNKNTDGLIPTAVTPDLIKQDRKLFLVNVMHFKGKWYNEFPREATRAHPFYQGSKETTCVQMMAMKSTLKYSKEPRINAEIVQIPFKDPTYSLVIVLPNDNDDIDTVQRILKRVPLIDLLSDQDSMDVTLLLPRFKAEFQADLTDTLKELRTEEVFSDRANLPNIVEGNTSLKVDAIVHKALIEVNEEGATAAAATVSSVVPLMSPPGNVDVTVDHPFLFYIYNSESKIVLFEGSIYQPEQASPAECEAAKKLRPIKSVLNDVYNFDIRTGGEPKNNLNSRNVLNRFGTPAAQSSSAQPTQHYVYPAGTQNFNFNWSARAENVKPEASKQVNYYSQPNIQQPNVYSQSGYQPQQPNSMVQRRQAYPQTNSYYVPIKFPQD